MSIDIKIIPGTEASIPDPPRPKRSGDTDPRQYFPMRPMTGEQRNALRRAAEELSGALSGFWMHRVPGKRQAAINMDHYLTGAGQDREFSPGNVDDLFDTLTESSTKRHYSLEQGFLDKIREDLVRGGGWHNPALQFTELRFQFPQLGRAMVRVIEQRWHELVLCRRLILGCFRRPRSARC
ncbi:hypothetical protein [Rhodovulum sulfidophilum]|uniref:Uncharacterized protein n=1 Tax=Rhodovulum sulfidophilum TaxID=35806 RepID=A0ABS1RMB4_RHOSU|nr:hypothetical protein [Rhodovulum sulfidophilum]MBL3607188.1 hypothetical protein [Rhodovulum sulfidophilum]MCE8456664.1 hypothetical protein [Rhodovulum sulfidophilum]